MPKITENTTQIEITENTTQIEIKYENGFRVHLELDNNVMQRVARLALHQIGELKKGLASGDQTGPVMGMDDIDLRAEELANFLLWGY
jgi:hypothetical protein